MQEILRSDTENTVIPIPISGSPIVVTCNVVDMDTSQDVFSGSAIPSSSAGYYNLYLDDNASSYDRKVKIVTTSSFNSSINTQTNFFEISRPFATLHKLREDIEFNTPVSDKKLLVEERRIRTYIQSELLENFYKENKIVVSYGEDSDVLYVDTIQYADGFQDGSGNILADHIIQKFKSLRINPRII